MTLIKVTRCGRWAHAALTAHGSGRIVAVFRRSFYVETDAGLACVGPLGLGDGPLNALCDLTASHDRPAAGVSEGAILDCRRFTLDNVEIWRPRPIPASTIPGELLERLGRLSTLARAFARGDGLAPLVADAASSDGLLLSRARAPIDDLGRWLAKGVAEQTLPASALQLLGLGPGLTPSGDDYIGGVLVALHALQRHDDARALASLVQAAAQTGTSRISAAHLACAAEGEGAAPLHETIAVLLGTSERPLEECLAAVDSIGHSSGWDALAGAAAVLRVCAG